MGSETPDDELTKAAREIQESMVECQRCNGAGVVADDATLTDDMGPEMVNCGACNGSGSLISQVALARLRDKWRAEDRARIVELEARCGELERAINERAEQDFRCPLCGDETGEHDEDCAAYQVLTTKGRDDGK